MENTDLENLLMIRIHLIVDLDLIGKFLIVFENVDTINLII